MSYVPPPVRIVLRFAGIAAIAATLLPSPAQARLVSPSDCQPSSFEQPFAGDQNFYEQALGSYSLADGQSVMTQPVCVNLDHPAIRVVTSGDPGATVNVEAVFNAGAATVYVPVGSVAADSGTSPTMPIDVVNLAGLRGQNTLVTLELTAEGGNAGIDSVWVDPWRWW